jgi:hypothetical protein
MSLRPKSGAGRQRRATISNEALADTKVALIAAPTMSQDWASAQWSPTRGQRQRQAGVIRACNAQGAYCVDAGELLAPRWP